MVSLAMLLGGCAALGTQERATRFEEQTRDFGAALRWAYYDTAASFLRPRPGSPATPECVPRSDLRVTSYQARDQMLSDDATEARLRAVFGYVQVDWGTVREATDAQVWWYDPETKRWFLDGGLPRFLCAPAPAPARG
jgi:hypothetical protein